MTRRIEEDKKNFHDRISGKVRRALSKHIKQGSIIVRKGKDGTISIPIPMMDTPHFIHRNNDSGLNRGKGKEGDVIGRDPDSGSGSGDKAGKGEGEGIIVNLELEDVLKFMQDELQLPNLLPKENEVFEDVKIKYNNISLTGPNSLRHLRRTWKEAIKRGCAEGTKDNMEYVPGFVDPVNVITPIKSDMRYRQYNEIHIPSSNALIIFARDGSASMDAERCDIVSDMAWWLDAWVRQFYERVDRLYVWHDWVAKEVDEETFYKYRFGGGTACSSALKYISSQFENRYPPNKWNIYVFYFTDGDNWSEDNQEFIKVLKEDFTPDVVNFTGIVQVMSRWRDSVKERVDKEIESGQLDSRYVRTVSIGRENIKDGSIDGPATQSLSEEERNRQIMDGIRKLLGSQKEKV